MYIFVCILAQSLPACGSVCRSKLVSFIINLEDIKHEINQIFGWFSVCTFWVYAVIHTLSSQLSNNARQLLK